MSDLSPTRGLGAGRAYTVPASADPVRLDLAGNEGPAPDAARLRADLAALADPELARRYPRGRTLEAALARAHGCAPEQVLVTAGADDGLLRACLATLDRTRNAVLPLPSFEMIARHVRLSEGALRAVEWADDAPWPRAAVLDAIDADTGVVFVVSPNNPTGGVASAEDLRAVSAALLERAPGALLVLDSAYAEYADEDLGPVARALPNAVELRTFSKARGLAGLRVGYALGGAATVAVLGRAGNPYPCSGLARALAEAALEGGAEALARTVARTRQERVGLAAQLVRVGARPLASRANFVLARFGDAAGARRTWDALAARGVRVRRFDGEPRLADALRITCPADAAGFELLMECLEDMR